MTYKEFLVKQIYKYDVTQPIYTAKLADCLKDEFNITLKEASAATSVNIKRIMEQNIIPELRFFQKGIYFRTKTTIFGEMKINKNELIYDKYLKNDIGFETGLSLLHKMGITTQIPNTVTIATNKASDCVRKDKLLDVSICPPKIEINKSNKLYLQVLDAIDALKKAPVDITNPYETILKFIYENDLDFETLLYIASNYYSQNTVLQLGRIAKNKVDI